uniref:Uncharacterized protein n=1 Tax=Schistocephalus solidus TaxID=70667 RepID=A0A0X3Q204_SCHSO
MARESEEFQGYADRSETTNLFKVIKVIYGTCIKRTAPLLSSDGTTPLIQKSEILKHWAKHFISAFIDQLTQVDTNNDLHLPPSIPETIHAVQQISSKKA